MTRKARRKQRQEQIKRDRRPASPPDSRPERRPAPSWAMMGTLVASTAFAAAQPATASASVVADALRPRVPSPFGQIRRIEWAQSQSTAGQTPARRFDIAAGPLDTVIAAFEQMTGMTVRLSVDAIRLIQSPGVSGTLTPEAALQELLAGTNVAFRMTGPGAATLDLRRVAESVDVRATAPATVVSSPKYAVPLRDVAQTIAVIPRTVFEQQGAVTLSDTLRNVPGITLQAGEGGGSSNTAGDMFNMRGFNASNSLFVDGVRDDGLVSRDVFNLEQVEVFMGPTGSDVGRGTAAGYVNMQTKSPHMGASQSALLGYGSAGQKRFTADLNIPFAPAASDGWLSKSAVRLNALVQNSGVPGRDIVELESKGFAPSIGLGVGTPTRVIVAAQIVRQDNVPDYGIPGAAWLESPLTATTALAPAPVDQRNYYGSPAYDYDKASQDSYTARLEHDVRRNMTFRNQTRYNKTHRDAVISTVQNVAAFNAATNQVTVARQGNERENKVFSNQTSLVDRFATGRLRHASSLGIEYSREEQFTPTLTGVGTRAPVDIFHPDPNDPITGFAPARTLAASTGRADTIGLYAFDTVELTDRWQVSGGARWEYYDTSFQATDATGLTTTNIDASDSLVSGKAGLLFRVNANANVYVSFGSSVTPPGNANFALSAQANNQNNPSVKPQESKNYEVGAKWDTARGRLSLTSAVFRTENKNVIYTVDAAAVPPIYNQDDGQIVNGVTVGAMGRITDRWDVLANIGYLDTELQTQNAVNNGRRLTLTPALSGSLWTTYHLPRGFTVGGGIRHTDAVYINAANTIQSPGYHLVDALAEYAVNSHLSLRFNVYNLTDEVYIRNVNNNGGRYNPGNPRSANFTTNVRF
jgi:catecholate siderophore receptor